MFSPATISPADVDVLVASYQEFYGDKFIPLFADILRKTLDQHRNESGKEIANYTRERVWHLLPGGATSAKATFVAFAAIGHEDWCDKRWI